MGNLTLQYFHRDSLSSCALKLTKVFLKELGNFNSMSHKSNFVVAVHMGWASSLRWDVSQLSFI